MSFLRALRAYREPFLVLAVTLLSLFIWQKRPQALAEISGAHDAADSIAPEELEALMAADSATAGCAPSAALSARQEAPLAKEKILLLGDSMVEVVGPRLADYALENGHEMVPAIWYGSTTSAWAKSPELGQLLREIDPSLVIVVLGSSELTRRDIESRRPMLEALVKRLGSRKLVWIGPPNWRADTGINDLLESVLGKDRFFRSASLELTRKKDGIHPDAAGGRVWTAAFVRWLGAGSRYDVAMAEPTREATPTPARVLGTM
jgi:hypothetical protein